MSQNENRNMYVESMRHVMGYAIKNVFVCFSTTHNTYECIWD